MSYSTFAEDMAARDRLIESMARDLGVMAAAAGKNIQGIPTAMRENSAKWLPLLQQHMDNDYNRPRMRAVAIEPVAGNLLVVASDGEKGALVGGRKAWDWMNGYAAAMAAAKPAPSQNVYEYAKTVNAAEITVIDDGAVRYPVLTADLEAWTAAHGDFREPSIGNRRLELYDNFCADVPYVGDHLGTPGNNAIIELCELLIAGGASLVRL